MAGRPPINVDYLLPLMGIYQAPSDDVGPTFPPADIPVNATATTGAIRSSPGRRRSRHHPWMTSSPSPRRPSHRGPHPDHHGDNEPRPAPQSATERFLSLPASDQNSLLDQISNLRRLTQRLFEEEESPPPAPSADIPVSMPSRESRVVAVGQAMKREREHRQRLGKAGNPSWPVLFPGQAPTA